VVHGGVLGWLGVQPLPAGLSSVSFTPAVREVVNGVAFQTWTLKPWKPPWRLFGGLLMSSEYVLPSITNRPLAIRLP
jgi:hypothetical protein